jgi:hypothetical protein
MATARKALRSLAPLPPLTLVTEHRRKLAVLCLLSFLALC